MLNFARPFLLFLVMLSIASAMLFGCAREPQTVLCADPDFDCFSNQAFQGIAAVRESISYWSNINLIAQIFIALSGMVATVMIALQGDENRHWTRPIGLIATALVTGLTSALVSFHVPDNVDKLVDIVDRMVTTQVAFAHEAGELTAGKPKEEVEKVFQKDAEFSKAVNRLTTRFTNDYNKIKIDLLKLHGTAARLQTPIKEPQARK